MPSFGCSDTTFLRSYLSSLCQNYCVYSVRYDAQSSEFLTSVKQYTATSSQKLDVPLQKKNTELTGKSNETAAPSSPW